MSELLHKSLVLVLNRNWQAINTVSPAEIFGHMATDTATGLDVHGPDWMIPTKWSEWRHLPVRDQDLSLGTANGRIRIPTIVVLSNYDRVPVKRPKFSLKTLWRRDQGRCQYSGRELRSGEGNIDHILPRSRGGETTWENCVLADRRINQKKADKTPEEAGLKLRREPTRPHSVPVTYTLRNPHKIEDWEIFLPKDHPLAAKIFLNS